MFCSAHCRIASNNGMQRQTAGYHSLIYTLTHTEHTCASLRYWSQYSLGNVCLLNTVHCGMDYFSGGQLSSSSIHQNGQQGFTSLPVSTRGGASVLFCLRELVMHTSKPPTLLSSGSFHAFALHSRYRCA